MLISFTSSTATADEAEQIEEFLSEFLPRMRKQDGVEGIFHYANSRTGRRTTVVLWRDEGARREYVNGDLIQEALAFEKAMGNTATREAFPVIIALP